MLNLGALFEADLLKLAGLSTNTIDPGSAQIDLVNPSGPTTLRATVVVNVDTTQLKALIQKYTV